MLMLGSFSSKLLNSPLYGLLISLSLFPSSDSREGESPRPQCVWSLNSTEWSLMMKGLLHKVA